MIRKNFERAQQLPTQSLQPKFEIGLKSRQTIYQILKICTSGHKISFTIQFQDRGNIVLCQNCNQTLRRLSVTQSKQKCKNFQEYKITFELLPILLSSPLRATIFQPRPNCFRQIELTPSCNSNSCNRSSFADSKAPKIWCIMFK